MLHTMNEVKKRVAAMLSPLIVDGYYIVGRLDLPERHFVKMRHVRNRAVLTISATRKDYTIIRNGKLVKKENFA